LLVLAELAASGGFYIIFFGIAALAVGALAAFDVAGPVWVQLLLFSGISVLSLVVFRERLLRAFQIDPQAPAVDQLAGEVAVAMEDLAPGGVGRVELRGSAWSARNSSSAVIVRGSRSRVIRVEGLMLYVEPEGAR
jgi:inner membrane protein